MTTYTFQIHYHTRPGETVFVKYRLEGKHTTTLVPLTASDEFIWTGQLQVNEEAATLYYSYLVKAGDSIIRSEMNEERSFMPGRRSRIALVDHWTERPIPGYLFHSAFTECVFRRSGCAPIDTTPLDQPYLLLLRALPPVDGYRWGVIGNSETTGKWRKIHYLVRTGIYEWGIALTYADFTDGLNYKYVLVNERDPEHVVWEEGENRFLRVIDLREDTAAVHTDDSPRITMQPWRGAGVVIPVFSLRSEGSQGVGDFGDLLTLVRHAPMAGLSAVQILPINDTASTGTWRDSYPYSGISVYAFHPIYIDMRAYADTAAYHRHEAEGAKLNVMPTLDYERTYRMKMAFLLDLFDETGASVLRSTQYERFAAEQNAWLTPYARYSIEKARQLQLPHSDNEDFYRFVQYELHRQLSAVHDEARRSGVILKGDIPIGICRDSVDAQCAPRLYHMNGQAGAPPDAFARQGQNWGFPTYDWEEMSRDRYAWWRTRLEHMGHYFDAFRIDHVLGFFRIWEIPINQVHGTLGYFRPALPLSVDEIRESGFEPSPLYYSRARINEADLHKLEHQRSLSSIRRYLDRDTDGTFVLRSEVDNGRKIERHIPDGPLRKALMDICAEVLFVTDPDCPNHFHPRIAAGETRAFRSLDENNKKAWGYLHDNFFYHRHNDFWADKAMGKLPAILSRSSRSEHHMLPCAEDLGMVPPTVKNVLERLQVLSLEIQRMPKRYGVRFDCVEENPYLSVATIATHDMPPLRLWWKRSHNDAEAFYHDILRRDGEAPSEATPEICETIVARHLESPSMLCLLALQDYLAIDARLASPHPESEQINDPANPNQNWNYRMHLTLETLFSDAAFVEKLRTLIQRSGRCY